MQIWLIFLLILITFTMVLIFSKISIIIIYKDNNLTVVVKIWGLFYTFRKFKKGHTEDIAKKSETKDSRKKLKGQKASLKKDERVKPDREFTLNSLRQAFAQIKEGISTARSWIFNLLNYFGRRASIEKLSVKLDFGTGDPPSTGIATGIVWGIYGTLYALLSRFRDLSPPDIALRPDFTQKRFDLEVEGIISIRIAHIIFVLFVIILKFRSLRNFLRKIT